jgi:ubiquitin-protein ligase E3 A
MTLICRSCVHSLTADEKRALLSFVSGSDRAPIRGLSDLKMVVQRAGPDSERLPTASTCFYTLLLPEYATEEKLQGKLKAAIKESQGFGLM